MSAAPPVEDLIAANMLFAGTPDQVFDQIKGFWEHVGGFGHLLVQVGGTMEAEESADSIRLFAKEVHPRFADLTLERRRAS
jgi:alkanesulfonate monooxygenase SsuD/methylene tetrahydromethanopterin reductase-like flavin-dependent oxidoreductase (luciferase family)